MPGRSKSRGRTYPVSGNQVVDAKSKQLLFKEFEVTTMGRTVLKSPETFTESTADTLVTDHMKKKKKPGTMNFLVDRIRFGKKTGSGHMSNREYLTYREIKQCYRFASRPDVFMLCIEDEQTEKRSYETYRCQNGGDLVFITDLIDKTTNDPQFLMRLQNMQNQYTGRLPETYTSPPPEPVNYGRARSSSSSSYERRPTQKYYTGNSSHIDSMNDPIYPPNEFVDRSTTNLYSAYDRPDMPPPTRRTLRYESPVRIEPPKQQAVHHVNTPNLTASAVYYDPSDPFSPVYTARPVPQSERVTVVHNSYPSPVTVTPHNAPQPRMASMTADDPLWRDDVTYLLPNTSTGPEIADRGSVYLYVARTRHENENPQGNYYRY